MNLDEVLHQRRSVRVYDKEKPIDTEKVKHCLELATLAPNSSDMQLWEFYHITEPELLAYSILNGRTFVITVLKNVRTNVLRIGKYITVY